jgi:hypothetical protein
MTSNLLFGSRQHVVDESSWVPVHGFRKGRIKLLTGSPAPTRGGRSRPIRVSRCGLDSLFLLQRRFRIFVLIVPLSFNQ